MTISDQHLFADDEVSGLEWIGLNADLSMVASAFGLDPLAHLEEGRHDLDRAGRRRLREQRTSAHRVRRPG